MRCPHCGQGNSIPVDDGSPVYDQSSRGAGDPGQECRFCGRSLERDAGPSNESVWPPAGAVSFSTSPDRAGANLSAASIRETRRLALTFAGLILLAPVAFLPFALFYSVRISLQAGPREALLPFCVTFALAIGWLAIVLAMH